MKAFLAAGLAVAAASLAAYGCGSAEPEGPMPGDAVGLGNYAPDAPTRTETEPAAGSSSSGSESSSSLPLAEPSQPPPSKAVERTNLGYAPDASAAPAAP